MKTLVTERFDPAHPELGFDVAVLTLTRPALGHTIASIAHASDDPVEQGTHVRIFGFGLVPRGRTFARQPNRLHDASLEYLAPHACFTGPVAQMAETRMCAASPTSGVCPGDSGGPAVREIDGQSFVVGLVSLAIDAQACTHTAAVLTRVSAMRPFIEAHVPGVR